MASADQLRALPRRAQVQEEEIRATLHERKSTGQRFGERKDSHFILEGVTDTEACGYPGGGSVVAPARTGPAQESVNRDVGVRPVLRTYRNQQDLPCPDPVLIEELGLCQGRTRIDLATVGGVLHGYEIKSNRDRLSRLASQAETYSRVFDRVTLVVGTKHVKAGLRLVPRWWGVLLVRGGIEGALLDPLRLADEESRPGSACVGRAALARRGSGIACGPQCSGGCAKQAEASGMGPRVRGAQSDSDPSSGAAPAQDPGGDLNLRVTSCAPVSLARPTERAPRWTTCVGISTYSPVSRFQRSRCAS